VALPSANTSLARALDPVAEHDRAAPLLEKPALRAAPSLDARACATAASLRRFGDDCLRLYNCARAIALQYLCAQA